MDKLELTTGRLERNMDEGGETLIQISMQYPTSSEDGACFSRMAENVATALSLGMLREAQAAAGMMPEALPYQISGTFTSTYNARGVFSYYTDVFLYAGGMRGITYRYGSSFLMQDDFVSLFLTSFFPAGVDVRSRVTDFVTKRHGYNESAVRKAFSPENIYLTERGLAVFFHPGAVAPVAGGVSVFTMPYSDKGPFDPSVLTDK